MAELPRVKVCGLTRSADVQVALDAGADALGFVHHDPSPRSIEPTTVAGLVEGIPAGVATVAVLVDATPEVARGHLVVSGVEWVQLCGSEDPELWRGFDAPILRRLPVDATAEEEVARWSGIATGFVLDHPSAPGGTGLGVDLELAARLSRMAPCLLAGGMAAENVAERIRAVRPFGVDGSSRLETAPGTKDSLRVEAFVAAARETLGEIES